MHAPFAALVQSNVRNAEKNRCDFFVAPNGSCSCSATSNSGVRGRSAVWYTAEKDQVQKLRDVVFQHGHLNKDIVGRSAREIAAKGGPPATIVFLSRRAQKF